MAVSGQVQAALDAAAAFEKEVGDDFAGLDGKVADLNRKVADLQAQVAAGTGISADDAAALAVLSQDLTDRTKALHEKYNPAA